MRIFHRTPYAKSILENGFRDGEGLYMTTIMHKGVWLSDCPLDFGQGAKGRDLLCLDIPDDVLEPFEWIEEGKSYREWLVPAEVVNHMDHQNCVTKTTTTGDRQLTSAACCRRGYVLHVVIEPNRPDQ